jgi:cytochrome c oxidase subunit 4
MTDEPVIEHQASAEEAVAESVSHRIATHNDPEHIRKETRVYLTVFAGLATLTAATVGVSYLRLDVHLAIVVALCIACIKGFLVAGYFMHLLSEKKLIYSVLLLTAIFFIALLFLPMGTVHDKFGS